MAAMMAISQPILPFPKKEIVIREDTSYLRKKCKSCKLFPCYDDRHKWRPKPLAQACKKYEK